MSESAKPAPAPTAPGPMPVPAPPKPTPVNVMPTKVPDDSGRVSKSDDTVKGTGTTKPDGVMSPDPPPGPAAKPSKLDPLVAEVAAFRAEVEKFIDGDDGHGGLLRKYTDLRTRVNDELTRASHASASGILDVVAGLFREAIKRL